MLEFDPYTPVIQDPYPDGWSDVSGFTYDSHLYLARAKQAIEGGSGREAEYIVSAEYKCSCKVDGRPFEIRVPSGMLTDLSSVPWIARFLVGRVGPHLEAAIIHDFLFIAWQDMPGRGARDEDFRFANEVMRQAMIAADVGLCTRTAIGLAISSWFSRQLFFDPNPGTRYVRVPAPTQPTETAAA